MFSDGSQGEERLPSSEQQHNEELVRVGVLRARAWIAIASAGAALVSASVVSAGDPLRVDTNETYLAEIARAPKVDVGNVMAVFELIFRSLPSRVEVKPTENYYYFRFVEAGVPWAGSIRLGPGERAERKIDFGFYKDLADWADEMAGAQRGILGAEQGVEVAEEARLSFRITYKGHSVLFALNDLSGVAPPAGALLPSEKLIGPIFDESGLRFFLVYNASAKVFHYVLDETVPVADDLIELQGAPRIAIGRRTGFAFYRDQLRERRILIGVNEVKSRLNSWFDGPFDQLPENFIEGETLRAAILDADPSAKGEIDRFGNYLKEEGRYLIHPYMLYRKPADLVRIHTCATQRLKRLDLYAKCFDIPPDPSTFGPPPDSKAGKK